MLYPSLLIQKIFRPLLPLLEKLSPARFHSTDAHQTSLTSVETDDVAVLFRYLDGFFLYGFFLSFDEEDRLPWFDPRVRDTSERDMTWLDALWRRSLVLHKSERNIAKLFSLAVRLPQFLRALPRGADPLHGARSAVDHPELDEPGGGGARSRLRILVSPRGGAAAVARPHVQGLDPAVAEVPRGLDDRGHRQEAGVHRPLRPHDVRFRGAHGRDVHVPRPRDDARAARHRPQARREAALSTSPSTSTTSRSSA